MACLFQSIPSFRLFILVLGVIWMIFASPQEIDAQTYRFTLDFEDGTLRGWDAWGDAFKFQPTRGDNPTARKRGQPSNHQGNYWIGTYERYQGKPRQRPGDIQGDAPQGFLTSSSFTIPKGRLTFLVGGGSSSQTRVELWAGQSSDIEFMKVVHAASGKNSETMERVSWDLSDQAGKIGKIRIVDASSGPWGHINVDDFQFVPPKQSQPAKPTLVPNVVGQQVKTARAILAKARLNPGEEVETPSGRPEGTVLGQKPGAGARVQPGTTVDLWVTGRTLVPNVIGQKVETARAILAKAGLKPGEEAERTSGRPEGTVLDQKPGAGARVQSGTTVDLLVAGGTRVPNVIGQKVETARSILAKAGLKPSEEMERPSGRPEETVLDQRPQAGERVPFGTPVRLVVAVPPPPTMVEVPPVEGRVIEEAVGILRNARLRSGGPEKRPSDARPGTVIEQSPGPGELVEVGSRIDLVVAILPPSQPIEVPDVVGLPRAKARQILEERQLILGVIDERESDQEADIVLEQSPGGGSEAQPGDAVSLVVAVKGQTTPWGKVGGGLVAVGVAGGLLWSLRRRLPRNVGGKGDLEVIPKVDAGFQELRLPLEKYAPNWELVLRPVVDPGAQVLEVSGPLIAEKEDGND